MSYLEKILEGVDVQWKPLGELAEIIRGVRVTKKDLLADGKYPVVSGGTGYMGYINCKYPFFQTGLKVLS
jgi:type I restriction enzyme S subunit